MQKKTLLILAAGMGSRYGGLKQLDQVGPAGETIIEYSVYDALKAGFNKLVFIIRDEFKQAMKDQITSKFENEAEIIFVNQAIDSAISGVQIKTNRSKPWGTGHAVLVAKDIIQEPFAVINADDFYGRDGFIKMSHFLSNICAPNVHGLIAYILKNTLSENGYVSRGVCTSDIAGNLNSINERTKIKRNGDTVVYSEGDQQYEVAEDSLVSMNFWGFHDSIFDIIQEGFKSFIENIDEKSSVEYYIPLVADDCIRNSKASFRVITSTDQWYGVTYKEDKPDIEEALKVMTQKGLYPSPLF
jgi:UTP-glucose-1-phosphate uridylyltransferase